MKPHWVAILFAACTTQVTNNYYVEAPAGEATPEEDATPVPPPFDPALAENTATMSGPYSQDGVVYWFDISSDQVTAANELWFNGWGGGGDWSTYSVGPDTEVSNVPHTNSLFVYTPESRLYDFGQVEVQVAGQSSGMEWAPTTIPNLHIDADELQEGLRIGGVEHLRLNNGMVGSMFGEPSALATHRLLGYAAPRTSFALVGGTPWENSEQLIPMINVEVYKKDFCEENAEFFGGGCTNIWEWAGGDFTPENQDWIASECQSGECTTKRLQHMLEAVSANLGTQEFNEELAPFIDWEAFHAFQCISWLVVIPDDMIHVMNNVVMAEGLDGKFRFLPYSTDISATMGFDMSNIDLYGINSLTAGCQYDESCWADTISTCEGLIDAWEELDPATTVVDAIYSRLRTTRVPWGNDGGNGMLRGPDESRYHQVRDFYAGRAATAREDLELYRAPWVFGEVFPEQPW